MKSAQKKAMKAPAAPKNKVVKKTPTKKTTTTTKRTLTSKPRSMVAPAPFSAIQPQLNKSPLNKSIRKIVTELETPDQAREFVTEKGSGKKLTVVDFYADWCGPCRALGPKFKQMSEDFPNVAFAKVNADEFTTPDIDDAYPPVSALPTVMFFVDGVHKDTVVGLNTEKILENVKKFGV